MAHRLIGRSGPLGLLAAACSVAVALAPSAADAAPSILDEMWVGAFAHDINHIGDGRESGTADIQLELDSKPPPILRAIGAPRINATISANTAGHTNFGSLGLTWNHKFAPRWRGTLDFGLALTDGVTGKGYTQAQEEDPNRRLLLGSKVLFREAIGVDYMVSERWRVGIEFVHLSNGHILASDHNDGINDLGLRVGYRFQ